jgi:hypothetical protein
MKVITSDHLATELPSVSVREFLTTLSSTAGLAKFGSRVFP